MNRPRYPTVQFQFRLRLRLAALLAGLLPSCMSQPQQSPAEEPLDGTWSVAFEKRGKDWVGVEGAPSVPLRAQGLKQLVAQLGGNTSATELVDPATAKELGLDEPGYSVTVVGLDGEKRIALAVADRESNAYYVRLDVEQETPVVYSLTRYAFDRLFPQGGSLFEFAPLGAEDITRFEVTRDDGDIVMTRDAADDDWTVATPAWPLEAQPARRTGA